MIQNRAPTILFFLAVIFLSLLSPLQTFSQEETKEQRIQRLTNKLKNGKEKEQVDAVSELAATGKEAIPILIEELKRNQNADVLDAIARVFVVFGKAVVPRLIAVLRVELSNYQYPDNLKALRYTSNALKFIAAKYKGDTQIFRDAVPPLIEILKSRRDLEIRGASNYELQDFDAAADCLAYIGREAKDAVPLLIELLKNEKYRPEQHYTKKDSIVAIIKDLKIHSDFSANDAISDAFEKYKNDIEENDRLEIGEWLNELKTAKEIQDFTRWFSLRNMLSAYLPLTSITIFILIIFLSWLSIFYLKPLLLLKPYEIFPVNETQPTAAFGKLTVPIHYLLAPLVFRPRVLDAWVKEHLEKARESFSKRLTVKERQVYVPVGLFIDERLVSHLSPNDLWETFSRNQSRLLILGVGGMGKTSLACQLANWAMREKAGERLCPEHLMIPVLLEHDFDVHGEDALKKEIKAQLTESIGMGISNALLQALLESKRLLLLLDGMSERNDETRAATRLGVTQIPTNAVILTSRRDEIIGELNRTVIKPTKIKGNELSDFVGTYLTGMGKRDRFKDEEFFEACRLLSTIVIDRDITVLLAKLFVDLMIAKQEKMIEEEMPQNIPQLMLQSIKVLHTKTPSDSLPLRDVIKASKIIAWACLKKDYRPLSADYEEVRKSLANLQNGEKSLNYLKDKLMLIESASFDEKIRFQIDPLAEYLAAMYLVEDNKYNEQKWYEFIKDSKSKPGAPESIRGFLLAVWDYCITEDIKNDVPTFVFEKLANLISTDR